MTAAEPAGPVLAEARPIGPLYVASEPLGPVIVSAMALDPFDGEVAEPIGYSDVYTDTYAA